MAPYSSIGTHINAPACEERMEPMPDSTELPTLRFSYPEELHRKVVAVLDVIEQGAEPTAHRQALGNLVVELTGAGLHDYFLNPLTLANAGFLTRQSAGFGVSSAVRIMSPLIRTAIGHMDKDQLLVIAAYIRHLMR